MRSSIIVGISGYTGKALMESLLNNRHFRKIIVLTRRENKRLKNIHLKKVMVDFSNLENYKEDFVEVEDLFCLLGTDYISTVGLEDAQLFEYDYPMAVARVAKIQGVKNFFLLNPSNASAEASEDKLKLRAKLAKDIEALGFENFYLFKVNGIRKPVNVDGGMFAIKKSVGTIFNLVGMGLLDKYKITPANLLAKKMVEVALSNPLDKKVFLPKDY
jgi:nucleoside-diphosphate-sugar epimerase